MATKIEFRNEQTDEIKTVKVGWSWTLFLFGGVLGIPLFLRKVYQPAIAILAWNVITILVPLGEQMDLIIKGVAVGLAFYLGAQGNKITAQYYLKNGWSIVDPDVLPVFSSILSESFPAL